VGISPEPSAASGRVNDDHRARLANPRSAGSAIPRKIALLERQPAVEMVLCE
jgi:hypothetical protein